MGSGEEAAGGGGGDEKEGLKDARGRGGAARRRGRERGGRRLRCASASLAACSAKFAAALRFASASASARASRNSARAPRSSSFAPRSSCSASKRHAAAAASASSYFFARVACCAASQSARHRPHARPNLSWWRRRRASAVFSTKRCSCSFSTTPSICLRRSSACLTACFSCSSLSKAASSSARLALRALLARALAASSSCRASANASSRARSAMPALWCTSWRTCSVSARTISSSSARVRCFCFSRSSRLLRSISEARCCSTVFARLSSRSCHAWPLLSEALISWRRSCSSEWISRCILDGPGMWTGSPYAMAMFAFFESVGNSGTETELEIEACTVALTRLSVLSSLSFSYCMMRLSKGALFVPLPSRVGGMAATPSAASVAQPRASEATAAKPCSRFAFCLSDLLLLT